MEEQTTWKGHSVTLLVFIGIVVLCSIFFMLGMLAGRVQLSKAASAATAAQELKADVKPAPKEDKPDFTFYDAVKKEEPAILQPPRPDPPPDSTAKPKSEVASKTANAVNYQIGAVRKAVDAEKLLRELKKKGFHAFMLAPTTGDPNPFFRVQVGPFADPTQALDAKKKLESAGYQPIVKK